MKKQRSIYDEPTADNYLNTASAIKELKEAFKDFPAIIFKGHKPMYLHGAPDKVDVETLNKYAEELDLFEESVKKRYNIG